MRPFFSLLMVRETSAVCVLWNPERMPQETVTKKIGMKWPQLLKAPEAWK